MRPPLRRLTFQLVSLFDMLIIIVFAQYLDLRDRSREEVARAEEAIRAAAGGGAQAAQIEIDLLRRERDAATAKSAEQARELSEELSRTREDLARLGSVVARLFDLDGETLDTLLQSRAPEDSERIRRALKTLAEGRAGEAVRHVLTLAELEKRCDVWQIHIGDDGAYSLQVGGRSMKFRGETADRFAAELFKHYKSMPQPKSLVLILISWGDAELRARRAAVEGVEEAAERMRADSDRRTRFEYAVLGYIPGNAP